VRYIIYAHCSRSHSLWIKRLKPLWLNVWIKFSEYHDLTRLGSVVKWNLLAQAYNPILVQSIVFKVHLSFQYILL
jgi:hypothetical protein